MRTKLKVREEFPEVSEKDDNVLGFSPSESESSDEDENESENNHHKVYETKACEAKEAHPKKQEEHGPKVDNSHNDENKSEVSSGKPTNAEIFVMPTRFVPVYR